MTTAELIKELQEADPSGQRTVCVHAVGFKGGVGNSWADLPSVLQVHKGFDWECGMVQIILDKPVRFNEKAKKK